jgi:hypothetical protein
MWLQLLSFAIFLGVIGGGAFLLLKSQSSEDSEPVDKPEGDDVLGNARRIMDKYK